MATARQRAEWARIGVLVASIGPAVWSKEAINPERVIPEAYRPPRPPPRPKTAAEIADESARGWRLLDRMMTEQARRK